MKQLRTYLAAGAILGLAATGYSQATLQGYTSTFFFGDSLTDMGNLFFLVGQPPAPYYNGRFSNGPVYAEYLVSGLQRSLTAPGSVTTNLDFAFAGATATTTYANGSTPATLAQEIGMYQLRGLTPKATDLFVIWAGANDVLNYLGSTPTPSADGANASASASANSVTGAAQALIGLGAKNLIVMTLPDIGRTARFTTGSAAPASLLATGAVQTYGSTIRSNIAALATSTGANITLVDTTALLNTIINNAAHFGFTDTTHDVVDTLTSGGTVANPNSYIFWDGIHPTTAAHQLLAQAITEIMNPQTALGSASVQGAMLGLGGDTVADALDRRLAFIRGSSTRHQADAYVAYDYAEGGLDAAGDRNQFDYSGNVVTAGFDSQVAQNLTLGIALGAENFNTRIKPAAGSFKMTGHLVTGYAQWHPGNFFAEASAGLGSVGFDNISRVTTFGLDTSGTTNVNQRAFGLKLGADFDLGGFRLTPYVGGRYLAGRIEGYTETGVGGLNFAYGSENVKPLTSLAGIDASWSTHLGEMPLGFGLSCVFQNSRSSSEAFSGSLANTVAPTATINPDVSGGSTVKFGARVTGAIAKKWSWSLGYTGDARSDGKVGSQAILSLQTGY